MAIALCSKTVRGAPTNEVKERTSSQFSFLRSAARAAAFNPDCFVGKVAIAPEALNDVIAELFLAEM